MRRCADRRACLNCTISLYWGFHSFFFFFVCVSLFRASGRCWRCASRVLCARDGVFLFGRPLCALAGRHRRRGAAACARGSSFCFPSEVSLGGVPFSRTPFNGLFPFVVCARTRKKQSEGQKRVRHGQEDKGKKASAGKKSSESTDGRLWRGLCRAPRHVQAPRIVLVAAALFMLAPAGGRVVV